MNRTWVLLDDDPTGAQLSRDVPVLLDWAPDVVAAALAERPPVLHIVTNSRALEPAAAYRVTAAAAEAVRSAHPGARLALRGDSTLRAHLFEEYAAVRDVAFPGRNPVLLLVPALPSAGRVTSGGVHYLVQNGRRTALADTEYAHDGGFAYTSAHLLAYAEERTGGRLPADRGRVVPLAELRRDGAAAVVAQVEAVAGGGDPAAVAVDIETGDDLEPVAAALDRLAADGRPVICRCAPALAAVLAGGVAPAAALPPAPHGVLVVCGSYVDNTTAQLRVLRERTHVRHIEADPAALCGDRPETEIARLGAEAGAGLAADGLAVLTTPRHRPHAFRRLDAGLRIAAGLAAAAAAVRPCPSIVITKGGITSAAVIRHGFDVVRVRSIGPVLPGVALWQAPHAPAFVVFPGNVGTPGTLADLVALAR